MIRHSCWLVTDVPVCLALSTHESRGSWLMRSWLCLCDHESRGSWLMRSWLCLCDHESRGSWLMRSWLCLCDHEVVSHDSWGHVSQYSWESWVMTHEIMTVSLWSWESLVMTHEVVSHDSWESWVMTHEVMTVSVWSWELWVMLLFLLPEFAVFCFSSLCLHDEQYLLGFYTSSSGAECTEKLCVSMTSETHLFSLSEVSLSCCHVLRPVGRDSLLCMCEEM